ncbi:hypothetical protein RHECNPAF_64200111 [Rhizobium etli CNPAF512]|nr:hypothetical protein RHECNPAF_64200111 [Rhizobium etli CNPAF512]
MTGWKYSSSHSGHEDRNGSGHGDKAHGQDGVTIRRSAPCAVDQAPDGAFFVP